MKPILIIGSGIAGLIAALELSQKFLVTLVTKARLAESNTRYAQGGIAAVMFSDDSVRDHIADTLTAGAGLCNPEAVEILCAEGPDRIRDLIALGVSFDMHEGEFSRGLEAAHSYPRVLHAGGDATGLTIENALVRAVRATPAIAVLEDTFAVDLILNDRGEATALAILTPEGRPRTLEADSIILASGGAGQLFLHTTNPSVATGDGVAMALRAGAQLADLEFYQFHPTALAVPGSFLVSEAVRGDGAVLLDAHGTRFMQAIHPLAELAPRDVVARGIAQTMAAQNGQPALLDATHLGPAGETATFLARRFPTIDAACKSRGLDWATTPIPVTPAAHYWMGGIRTDLHGRTSIPGLYAVGEVACTGVHGANRLASNSLLESLVYAWRCAHLLLSGAPAQPAHFAIESAPATLLPLAKYPHATNGLDRLTLQTLMWTHAGIERSALGLSAAAAQLAAAHITGATVEALETANLLAVAQALVNAALARLESRGAHFRTDFPQSDPAFQHSLLYAHEPVHSRLSTVSSLAIS